MSNIFTTERMGYNVMEKDNLIINWISSKGDYLFLYFLTPMKVELNGETMITKENACILYSPKQRRHYSGAPKFKNSFIHFFVDEDYLKRFPIKFDTVFYPEDYTSINEIIRKIYIEKLNKNTCYKELIDSYLIQLLSIAARSFENHTQNVKNADDLLSTFENLRIEVLSNFKNPVNIDELAARMHLSRSQFYKYYKIFFHQSPKAEILSARLNYSKFLLENERISINEIAQNSGFNNICHFIRIFKKHFGCTPGEYADAIQKERNTLL